MVKFEFGKFDADTASFIEESQFLSGKVSRHFLDQEPCQVARVFRHLDHGTVAGGKDIDQRDKAQIDRKIPRHNAPDHAQRLRNDPIPGTQEIAQIDRSSLRAHPLLEVLKRVLDRVQGREYFGEQGFVA